MGIDVWFGLGMTGGNGFCYPKLAVGLVYLLRQDVKSTACLIVLHCCALLSQQVTHCVTCVLNTDAQHCKHTRQSVMTYLQASTLRPPATHAPRKACATAVEFVTEACAEARLRIAVKQVLQVAQGVGPHEPRVSQLSRPVQETGARNRSSTDSVIAPWHLLGEMHLLVYKGINFMHRRD